MIPLPLEGAAEFRATPHRDDRGFFCRWFCQRELDVVNAGRPIQQINCSHTTRKGTIRGLHFQLPPHAEDKVVRCIRGRLFDVIVDIRRASSTFGKWHGLVLDAGEMNMVYVPRGFAHGFQTLEDDCQILYLHTEFHAPGAEAGLRYDSPALNIAWPLEITEFSHRDRTLPLFDADYEGIEP